MKTLLFILLVLMLALANGCRLSRTGPLTYVEQSPLTENEVPGKYTFRYQDDDFKLIGYDQADHQVPVLHYSYSFNFLTGKKQTMENVNFYSEHPEDEKLEETWEDLKKTELISLSSIEDFDELHFD